MRPQPAAAMYADSRIRLGVLVGVALILAVGLAGPAPAYAEPIQAPAGAAQALRPTLPRPSGDDRVGVVPLHVVDATRPDPWVPAQQVRELMVSVWYPARRAHDRPLSRGCRRPPGPSSNMTTVLLQVSWTFRTPTAG